MSLPVASTHHIQEGVLQGSVLRGRLVKEVQGEVHVGDPQAEEDHQLMALTGCGHGGCGQVFQWGRDCAGLLLLLRQEAAALFRLRRLRQVQLHRQVLDFRPDILLDLLLDLQVLDLLVLCYYRLAALISSAALKKLQVLIDDHDCSTAHLLLGSRRSRVQSLAEGRFLREQHWQSVLRF